VPHEGGFVECPDGTCKRLLGNTITAMNFY
jgi:hypothetical protein